ncbi:MAG: sodium:glutamate symporter [[Clostridium] aminophilum]|uniref:sodium:glutamate symporter n=1 Tax=[Clostridium] aminophilum TaxID=1526 RepID=UPI0026EEB3EB|nr:sodium:glutamate symporter [[Clostridium] aminophilum]MDD6197342.1 sodium:glutamate symporter [[Clostridium] aminophilum]
MKMTVALLFNDMVLIGVFMLVGYAVRQVLKPIQKLFLPASLIGGVIALVLGQQCLNVVAVPESFEKFSNVLIAPIMAALLFGITITKDKVVRYLDYVVVEQGVYSIRMALGPIVGIVLGTIWVGLPLGWGSLGQFAFQGAWLLTAVFAGKKLFWAIGLIWPGVSVFPSVIHGIIGGALVWNIAKLDKYVDVKLIHHISGFLLEVVVLTAIATLDLELVSTYIVPILVYTLIMTVITIVMCFGLSKLFCKEEWFEKALMAYGVGTGNTATGLALVRAVDPDNQSTAPDNHGIYSTVCCWKEVFIGLIPMWWAAGSLGPIVGIGLSGNVCGLHDHRFCSVRSSEKEAGGLTEVSFRLRRKKRFFAVRRQIDSAGRTYKTRR